MCITETCCFVVQLDLGCFIVGIVTIVCSLLLLTSWAAFFALYTTDFEGVTNMLVQFSSVTVYSITIVVCVLAILGVVASVTLIIGVKKLRPGLMLYYFTYGIILTIMAQLGALLELLQGYWICALVQLIISLFCIHCTVVVYSAYDRMLAKCNFGSHENLIVEDEENV